MRENETLQLDAGGEEAYWAAVVGRDKRLDGSVYFAVTTTGIFCRPSCPARRPKRDNVRFFTAPRDAMRAGFRPCKRCAPLGDGADERNAGIVARLCKRIEDAEEMPGLEALAGEAGLSAFHLHRLFKSITGVTPKAYMAAVLSRRVRRAIGGGTSITEAIYDAGFTSSSRFYEKTDAILGMTPRAYGRKGAGVRMVYAIERCWLGLVLAAATDRGICAVLFGDTADELTAELKDRFSAAVIEPANEDFRDRLDAVLQAVERPGLAAELPIDILGTAFQHRIWTALRTIPPGETATYKDIAARIGDPKASRAVAGACAANPIALAIPCHRVIREDGGLAGYRWGLERKAKLLAREKAAAKRDPEARTSVAKDAPQG
jgi:AraC family transcriptional regulator of adaptative response/methylated-DNA-[protein]-cysteine methyltransferase